jgi:predicted MFS family arabinose efflux permease
VFLPFAAWIVEHVSWRMAVMPGVVMCLVVAVLVLLFLQDRPADLGLPAFGQTEPAPPAAPAAAGSPIVSAFAVLRLAARSGTFWILFGTFFICGLSTNGLVQTHFIPFCGDYGLSGTQAATVLAVMGAFDICGTVASGWLSDRYDNRWLLFWYYGLRGLSLLYLPMSSFSFYGLSLFAVFYGLDWIATVPPTVRLTANIFGRDKAGIVFGWIFAGHQLGAATAAYGAGLSRSLILSYLPAFYVAGAACLIAAVAVLAVSRPARPAPATRRPSPAAA